MGTEFSAFSYKECITNKTFFKIFDSTIESILLYGSEICDMQCTEIVHVATSKRRGF